MRWDEQKVENDLRIPGVGDGTVTRTFDVPEAMGINFHEVRAKSALNRVPATRLGDRPKCGRCGRALFEGRPVALTPYEKRSRQTLEQEIRRPPVEQPETVHTQAPSGG